MARTIIKTGLTIFALIALPLVSALPGCSGTNTIAQRRTAIVGGLFGDKIQTLQMQPVNGRKDGQATARPFVNRITDDTGNLLAYTVQMQVVSRSGPFTILIVVQPDLCILRAEVLEYRADRGRQVCSPKFTDQFTGKCADDPIELDKDIHAMTGATISSRAMTEGAKNAIRIIKSLQPTKNLRHSLFSPSQCHPRDSRVIPAKAGIQNKKTKRPVAS